MMSDLTAMANCQQEKERKGSNVSQRVCYCVTEVVQMMYKKKKKETITGEHSAQLHVSVQTLSSLNIKDKYSPISIDLTCKTCCWTESGENVKIE